MKKPRRGDFVWTPKVIAKLITLWEQRPRLSTAKIAAQIGGGCTKNGAVGKARRLNLPARGSPIIRGVDHPRAKPKVERLPRPAIVTTAIIPIEKIRHAEKPIAPIIKAAPVKVRPCCWPIGEPGKPSFHFCNANALAGRSYCAEHDAIAYVRIRDRREDAA